MHQKGKLIISNFLLLLPCDCLIAREAEFSIFTYANYTILLQIQVPVKVGFAVCVSLGSECGCSS